MTRLLFISTGLNVGGAEISLLNILQHLDRTRFELHVISLTGAGEIGARIRKAGVSVVELNLGRRPLAGLVSLRREVRRRVGCRWVRLLLVGCRARLEPLRRRRGGGRGRGLRPCGLPLRLSRACSLPAFQTS